ncbi:hypothetical protein NIES4075_27830 [Tolypothrix sp. NIES-4075]|uniref:DUF975 domain-containing protein n=1 Tax=Tolypothrix sp. NIES-4075 TaxID=2005459 RepID=UPI000B5C94C4|nr:DUF975 domain-containing protein [Tolypothrix sp. NIES-4075]GAX41786.1 hypothetical protein NIES4075_27830 [Tolypothrix sp. NIES-4075]
MSFNHSPGTIQPLSLGNVVSAGIRLYRSNLKSYLKLAFNAYVWIFVPIYGWAKCGAILALISRLAFGELVEQPESIEGGRRIVNSRMWQFFIMGLLMFLIGLALIIPFSIFIGIVTAFFVGSIAAGVTPNATTILVISLLTLILIPVLFVVFLWVQARFFVVEVPLAIEDNIDGTSTIGRSWELTKGHAWRIVAILLVGYLITIPIQIPFTILSTIIQAILASLARENSGYAALSQLLSIIIGLISAALIVPFWQSIKAVVYYDLRSRREGMGLKLRDRDI